MRAVLESREKAALVRMEELRAKFQRVRVALADANAVICFNAPLAMARPALDDEMMNRPSGSTPQQTDQLLRSLRTRERWSRSGFWVTISAPTLTALFVPLTEGRGDVWWPRLGCAVTVSVYLYALYRLSLRRTLPTRLQQRRAIDFRITMRVLLVVSPVGGWLVGWWTALPHTAGLVVPLVLALLCLGINFRGVVWSQSGGSKALTTCLFAVVGLPASLLCGDGLLAMLLVGFRQPDPELVLAAWGVALISLLRLLYSTYAEHDFVGVVGDAGRLEELPEDLAEALVADWVRRRALRRSDRTDTSLILALANSANTTIAVGDLRGGSPLPFTHTPTVAQAEMVLRVAGSALDTLDELRRRDERRQAFHDKDVLFARGMVQEVRAGLARRLHRREESALDHFAASARYEEAGMPNMAALIRMWANTELCAAFSAPEDALQALRAIADDEGLLATIRRTAWLTAEIMYRLRDLDGWSPIDPSCGPHQVSPAARARDIALLRAEIPPGLAQMVCSSMKDVVSESLRTMEERAAYGTVLTPARGAGFDGLTKSVYKADLLLESAKRCIATGREDQARYLSKKAKAAALRYNDFEGYMAACNFLLRLDMERHQWHAAYDELSQAVEVAEVVRQQLLDPQRKSVSVYRVQQLWYVEMVLLLLKVRDGQNWPPSGAKTTAWETVERSRARALLELMGETLTIPADEALAPLIAQEHEALTEVRALRTQLVSIGGTAAEDADVMARVRRAERELRGVQDRIEAVGDAGVEYLRLRRGTPIGFAEIRELLREESSGLGQLDLSSR